METALRAVLALPAVRQRFAELGAQPAAAKTDKWTRVVEAARIQID